MYRLTEKGSGLLASLEAMGLFQDKPLAYLLSKVGRGRVFYCPLRSGR
jgi:hypothetical protein